MQNTIVESPQLLLAGLIPRLELSLTWLGLMKKKKKAELVVCSKIHCSTRKCVECGSLECLWAPKSSSERPVKCMTLPPSNSNVHTVHSAVKFKKMFNLKSCNCTDCHKAYYCYFVTKLPTYIQAILVILFIV